MKLTLSAIGKKIIFFHIPFFGIFLFLFSSFLFITQTHAIETQTISAYPTYSTDTDPRSKSWFIYSIPAGVTKNDSVTVVNNEKQQIIVKVYAEDSIKDNNGNFTLAAQDAVKTGVGSWVKMSVSEVTLNPGEHKKIPFTITIPSNAAIGDHSGGIVFQMAPQKSTTDKGMAINVVSRIGVRIYETVPSADQLNMSVRNLQYSIVDNHISVTFTVENNGTVHVSPTGTLEIKDIFGRVADRISLDSQLGIVLPGRPLTLTFPTHILPPILGWESASVAVYYSPTKAAVANLVIMPSPWGAFILAFIIISLVSLFILRKRLMIGKGEESKMILAPRTLVIVGSVLVGAIICSGVVAFLLSHIFGGQ